MITISKFPYYLCFLIKRFKIQDNTFKKIQSSVDFPEILNIYPHVDKEENHSFETKTQEKDCEYELFAVNEHQGTIKSGHYVTFVNVIGDWYCFNDSSVKKDNNYKTENSLVLFYKRKNIPEQ